MMKLSDKHVKILSAIKPGAEYTSRDLKCRYTTLALLAKEGYLAENMGARVWAFITRSPWKRKFMITDVGIKHSLRPTVPAPALPTSAEYEEIIDAAIRRQEDVA